MDVHGLGQFSGSDSGLGLVTDMLVKEIVAGVR